MESYRRTNEPGGLEVEPSTAGASGADDLDEWEDCEDCDGTGEEWSVANDEWFTCHNCNGKGEVRIS